MASWASAGTKTSVFFALVVPAGLSEQPDNIACRSAGQYEFLSGRRIVLRRDTIRLTMPTYLFECEGCGARKPFPLHDSELAEPREKTAIQKHCLACRTITTWAIISPEGRSGKDRHGGQDRGNME
jgi:hypothetical protein